MRRRQVYAAQTAASEEKAREAALQQAETGPQSEDSIQVPKGTCPKCKKHIGKGLHFHVKACQ